MQYFAIWDAAFCSTCVLINLSVFLGLPVSSKKDSSCLESTVPIVTDSCGVYGTFYVDLMGSGLKTFNSPGRVTKMSRGLPHKEGAETIQIFTHPASKPSPIISREALPWKQAIRPQPKMGVLRESWEKNHSKQGRYGAVDIWKCSVNFFLSWVTWIGQLVFSTELHAVSSVPILSTRTQGHSHIPALQHGTFNLCN